jgi:hypothetical protein
MYDWQSGVKSVTPEKKDFYIAELRKILKHPTTSVEAWTSCLFRSNHLSAVVPNLRLFLNSGFNALRVAKKTNSSIRMTSILDIDIVTIIRLLTVNGGREVAIRAHVNSTPDLTFYSDSSDRGVGGWH